MTKAKKCKGDMSKTRQSLLGNIINSRYQNISNTLVDMIWDEFDKKFPS